MNQDLIVMLIVLSTIGYTVFSFVKSLRTKKANNGCGGCTGCDLSKNKNSCNH